MNLEKAKQIFLVHYGNVESMMLDGVYDEYLSCLVPSEIEKQWLAEAELDLTNKFNLSSGNELIDLFYSLGLCCNADNLFEIMFKKTNSSSLDLYTRLLMFEYVASFADKVNKSNAKTVISKLKEELKKLENADVTIDNSFKSLGFMKEHIFSKISILRRIKNIFAKLNTVKPI